MVSVADLVWVAAWRSRHESQLILIRRLPCAGATSSLKRRVKTLQVQVLRSFG